VKCNNFRHTLTQRRHLRLNGIQRLLQPKRHRTHSPLLRKRHTHRRQPLFAAEGIFIEINVLSVCFAEPTPLLSSHENSMLPPVEVAEALAAGVSEPRETNTLLGSIS
jgi:hypothetical protein